MMLACLLVSGLLVPGFGTAQTYSAGLYATLTPDAPARLEPFFTLSDVEVEGARVEVRVAGLVGAPLEFGYGFRQNTSLGPIGNLVLRGRMDIDTAGAFDFGSFGDGVIGSVGARARLEVFNANPGRFNPLDRFAAGARSTVAPERLDGRVGFVVGGGVTYRIDRHLILDADPAFYYLSGTGLGVQLGSSLRLSRLVDSDDGVVLALGSLEPGASAGFAALGFEYRLNRRELPVMRGAVWLGMGSNGFSPGVRLHVSETRPAQALRYSAEVAAEPFRTDIAPYRLNLMLGFDAGPGVLEFRVLGAAGNPHVPTSLALGTAFAWRP
jgi:hypothetical protein